MRCLLICSLSVLLANCIQGADVFKNEKVTLGKRKCTCTFTLSPKGKSCGGKAKCDKKCSGSGEVEVGDYSFTLAVKKGNGKITKCKVATKPTVGPIEPTEPTTGPGSGETPVPITGSGSGETPAPITGSGSGETPVPITGSGSGETPVPITGSGSGPEPPMGEGMPCSCRCDCPDGSEQCECDCNCPMTSNAVMSCAAGFTRVCPMMADGCPAETMMMCPGGMPPATRMMHEHGSHGKGCQCVPDFLMALVSTTMPATTRLEATDRAKDVFKNEKVKLGKKQCTCTFTMESKGKKCSGQAKCDKKCSGIGAVEIGDYSFSLAVKRGNGKITKCKAAAPKPKPTEPAPTGSGSGPTPTGSGTGPVPPTGSGSGTGSMMSGCTCADNGGSAPAPPTGSGTGPGPVPPTGSGTGPGPVPPTGSGTGPVPPTGSGSGSGSIGTVTRVRFELYPGLTENVESVGFDGQSLTLEDSTRFDPSKPIKVVIHGWHESELDNDGNVVDNNGYPSSFNELYKSNGFDFTVLGVHWVPIEGWKEELQTSSSSDAGNALGLLLKELSKRFNISSEQLHVIGFSMGTVVTSKAAKKIQELGMQPLGRTTLLDPCPYHQASIISKTDALFVEAIHTSSQGICQETPLAHVDYYPNGGDAQLCGTGFCACPDGSLVCSTCYHGSPRCLFLGSPDWFANHFRAVNLYKESIGRPSAFLSWKCSETYSEFVENSRSCEASDTSERVPMGEHSVENGRPEEGLYFLTTSGVSPYYNN